MLQSIYPLNEPEWSSVGHSSGALLLRENWVALKSLEGHSGTPPANLL